MTIKQYINKLILPIRRYRYACMIEKREHNILKINEFDTAAAVGEDEWYEFWKPLMPFKCKWAYRLYAQTCGPTKDIICEPAIANINRVLNPQPYCTEYSDKNNFDRLIGWGGVFPNTILRKTGNITMDADYKNIQLDHNRLKSLLAPYNRVILKPTVDSNSGKGVMLFVNTNGKWLHQNKGTELTVEFIIGLKGSWILQEALEQHPFMAQFNPTSVNTLRLATYRSVKDNKVHLLSSVIRMGAQGACVDNLHKGGHMIRVMADGRLDDHCFDASARRSDTHGDIDFSKNSFIVPEWETIVSFAKKVAERIGECRLVQHDIMIDKHGNPRLIEYNVIGFSAWIAQFTGTPALSDWTDEIHDYVIQNINK